MIYRKSTYRRIIVFFLVAAGVVLISLLGLGIAKFRISETKMRREITAQFLEAIREEVKLKMEGVYKSMRMTDDPAIKKERNKMQTIITEDTVITKETEVNDNMHDGFMRNSQSYLLLVGRLQPDTLQQLFDAKLRENNFKVCSFIVVRYENNAMISTDTAGYRVNYRTPVISGGVFDEIAYEGLLSYSPFTIIRLMPKTALVVLLIIELLVLGVAGYFFYQQKKIQPDKIVRKGKNYYIGKTIFNVCTKELISVDKTIPLTQ